MFSATLARLPFMVDGGGLGIYRNAEKCWNNLFTFFDLVLFLLYVKILTVQKWLLWFEPFVLKWNRNFVELQYSLCDKKQNCVNMRTFYLFTWRIKYEIKARWIDFRHLQFVKTIITRVNEHLKIEGRINIAIFSHTVSSYFLLAIFASHSNYGALILPRTI